MCGIFGRFTWGAPDNDVDALVPLVDLLHHRGPDGGAYWSDGPYFFGHRRLAILDLSEAGTQPMATADGLRVVTFNGEIYNYVELEAELRAKGYTFHTRCDTEVLLHGWAEWGEGLLPRLTGMFAFALADRTTGELVLARDRFGEKPLLYRETEGEVVFASELAPLGAYASDRAIDPKALGGFLCLNYVPGERTLLAGVARVPPGGLRRYGPRGLVAARTWYRPSVSEDDDASRALRDERDVLFDLRERLDDAVRVALRSDVPIALFLSGGIDSSLVAESAVRQGSLDAAYCVDIQAASFSEWDNAQWVADRLGLRLERVPLGPSVLEDFLALVSHADDPLADSSAVAVWQLARETARHYKVAVSGDGGDELFGGYLTYKATAMHRAVTSRLGPAVRRGLRSISPATRATEMKVSATYKLVRYLRAADLSPAEAHFTWNGAWLPEDAARLLRASEAQRHATHAVEEVVERHGLPSHPSLGELTRADAHEYLPNDILAKVDRMTMAHSLESRAPLLDRHLASLAFGTTPTFEGSLVAPPKRLLRKLADRTFGPRVSRAKKQGFSIPVHAWLRGPARALVEDLLSESSVVRVGLLDPHAVGVVRDRLIRGHEPLGFEVWGLCVLVAWHRARVVGSARPDPERARRLVRRRFAGDVASRGPG